MVTVGGVVVLVVTGKKSFISYAIPHKNITC